jgi:serine protease Do
MSDNEILEQIERYLNGDMTKQERAAFEILRNENAEVNEKVAEHKHFTNLIKQYGERLELERRLDAIHDEIDVEALEDELKIRPSFIVRMWRNHHSKISVAASIAIFAVLCTLFFTGYLASREIPYGVLKGKLDQLQNSQNKLTNKVNQIAGGRIAGGNFKGTGFAISTNGLIVTDYHVVKDADSVYVQSVDGKSYKAKVIHVESTSDVAILQVTDTSFKSLAPLPYSFKKAEADMGENVFTLGFPTDALVLGPGFLTANSGYRGDSTSYQMSIPLNPGNSGGPLLDNKGNVIGIVDAKQTNLAGTTFALKADYLLKAIQNIPSDSLNKPLNLNTRNVLANLSRPQQIKKLQNYVFMIRVYQ